MNAYDLRNALMWWWEIIPYIYIYIYIWGISISLFPFYIKVSLMYRWVLCMRFIDGTHPYVRRISMRVQGWDVHEVGNLAMYIIELGLNL